jgi:hypothetical protein
MDDFPIPAAPPVPPTLYPGGPSVLGFILPYLGGVSGAASLTEENSFTELQTMLAGSEHFVDDTNADGISYPLLVGHSSSVGTAEAGIGVGMLLETETANQENVFETIGWFQAQTTQVGPGVTDSNLQFKLLDGGTETEVLRLSGRHADIPLTPPNSSDLAMLNLGNGGFSGEGEDFAGSSSGTVLAVNQPVTFEGDLLNLERAGLSRLRVQGDGRCGVGTATAPTAMFQITRPAILVPDSDFLAYLRVTGAADTFVQASDEPIDVRFELDRTVNLDTGDRLAVRSMLVQGATYSAVGTSTVTEAATLAIAGAPAVTGGNLTITNSYALWVTGSVKFDPGAQPFVMYLPQDNTTLSGSITGRIKVNINGQTRYLPYYTS